MYGNDNRNKIVIIVLAIFLVLLAAVVVVCSGVLTKKDKPSSYTSDDNSKGGGNGNSFAKANDPVGSGEAGQDDPTVTGKAEPTPAKATPTTAVKDTPAPTDTPTPVDNNPYSRGVRNNRTYENSWANIKATIASEWTLLSEEELKQAMAANIGYDMECPFAFYKMGSQGSVSIGMVMTHSGKMDLEEVRKSFEQQYGSGGVIDVDVDNTQHSMSMKTGTRKIDGVEYMTFIIKMEQDGMTMEMAFRECHDNGVVVIAAMVYGNKSVEDIFKLFKKME